MPRLGRLGGLVLLSAGVVLGGCGTSPASSAPASSQAPSPSVAAASDPCQPVDLRTPDGERVDLTGAWEGGVTFHEARQSRDCVWWVGFSSWPGDDLGDAWLLTFSGHLEPDFTLHGEWAEIYTAELHAPRNCPVTFRVEFTDAGEIELATDLVQDDPCNYYAATMVRVDGPPE
jgi:hypothetical protein